MDKRKLRRNEGRIFVIVGILFLCLTLNIVFPIIVFIMKIVFYVLGVILILGGASEIVESYKNKKEDEN